MFSYKETGGKIWPALNHHKIRMKQFTTHAKYYIFTENVFYTIQRLFSHHLIKCKCSQILLRIYTTTPMTTTYQEAIRTFCVSHAGPLAC